MNTYRIVVSREAEQSHIRLTEYRREYNEEFARLFHKEFFDFVESLEILPSRGMNLQNGLKAIIYRECRVVYFVDEAKRTVFILDICDPREHEASSKYLD